MFSNTRLVYFYIVSCAVIYLSVFLSLILWLH